MDHCDNVLDTCRQLGNCMNIDEVCKAAVINDKTDIDSTILVAFAGFTVLVYDHIITFNDELTFVWNRRKGLPGCLFLLNRYLIPLGFMVNLYAYQDPDWSEKRQVPPVMCKGVMTITGINVASLLMLLRIKALYIDNQWARWIMGLVGTVLAVEFGVNLALLATATSVLHLVPHASCSMVFTENKFFSSGSAWLPLLYDTLTFILTIYRVMKAREDYAGAIRSPILQALWEEGLMYYSVICAITLILTIMINTSVQGVQNITAQLELLLTVAMISRITLDLKKEGQCDMDPSVNVSDLVFHQPSTASGTATGFSQEKSESGSIRELARIRKPAAGKVRRVSVARRGIWWRTESAQMDTPSSSDHPVSENESKREDEWIKMTGGPSLARDMC